MKNLLAMILGLGAVGMGIWRLVRGDTASGIVLCAAGAFLLFRGLTGRVRPGL